MTGGATDGWRLEDHLHRARRGDPPLDYCLWPYDPPRLPDAQSWQSSALLYHSFAHAGLSGRMIALCDALRARVGPFGTVWGVKCRDGALSWEFYFYDYARMDRRFSIRDFTEATRGILNVDLPPADDRPYFMFSVEVGAEHLAGRPVEQIDLYIGSPDSALTSGICYGLGREGLELRNFYFFFDAARHAQDIRDKIASNAHVPQQRLDLDDVLWPEMAAAQTIVVANKRHNDGLYFSRIGVRELTEFQQRLAMPRGMRDFLTDNAARFSHLLFDVGYDYLPDPEGGLRYLKGSFYGLL